MKVVVGVSGGVDSSVAAYLLKKEGYTVVGVHFSLEGEKKNADDARAVCLSLGIEYFEADYSSIFNKEVFTPFIEKYRTGKTPNICVLCNREIKFGALLETANSLNADFIATGHYCSIDKNDTVKLKKPKDSEKDQTYFLNQVSEKNLQRALFPLAGLTKDEVRAIAEAEGLITAHKKGSSDICIMQNMSLKQFLHNYLADNVGNIVTRDGRVVGKHRGIHAYTIGQRKGLGIGGVENFEGRWFVVEKDAENNALIVSEGEGEELFSSAIMVKNLNFIGFKPAKVFKCNAKIRYRQEEQAVTVELLDDNSAKVVFAKPQRAAAIGQYCVFYDEAYCLGGGEIYAVL